MNNRFAVRQLSDLHRTVGTAREQPTALVDLELRDALANVLEEAAARVLAHEAVQQRVHGQSPNLDISISRSGHKVLLVRIYRQTFDWILVGLEPMSKYALANIKYAHVTLFAGRYQQLVLRCVRQARRALVVTRKRLHQCLFLRQQRIPYGNVFAFRTVTRCCNQTARTQKHEICNSLIMALISKERSVTLTS